MTTPSETARIRLGTRSRWLPLLALSPLAACGADAPARPDTVVSDSAGVRVVTSVPGPLPPAPVWQLEPEPVLEIGDADRGSAYQFFQVPSGTMLSNGTVVVADAGSRQLRAYDMDGSHLWSAGGEGDGPGEFQRLDRHWRFRGDSILAWDFQARRASIFGPSGGLTRSFGLTGREEAAPFLAGVLPSGALLVQYQSAYDRSSMQPGARRRRVEVRLEESGGVPSTSLGHFPGSEDLVLTVGGSPAVTGVLFGRGLHVSSGGDRIAIANDDAFSIRIHGSDGGILHVVRLDRDATPVRQDDFEAVLERGLESGVPVLQEMARERLRQTPRHETFPAFASIRLDAEQNLWVEEYRPPGVERRLWHVFDPQGGLITRLETPAALRILDIREQHILGVFVDERGVESLRLYRIATEE